MTRVYVVCSYDVFNIMGFFSELHKFLGPFQIEQSIQQSLDKCFTIWFFTDKVEVKEGESRQVDVCCTTLENGVLKFEIDKL